MSDKEKMVDLNINLDEATANFYNKKTKAELLGIILKQRFDIENQEQQLINLRRDKIELQKGYTKLNKNLGQAEGMIQSVIDSW